MNASWGETKEKDNYAANPRDYFVPDFGVDTDIKNVASAIDQSESVLGKTFTADFGAQAAGGLNPRDYVVPDFGVDQDIINVSTSIKNTEAKMKKTFTADFGAQAAAVNPRDYVVADYGALDQDIKNVKSSIASTEKTLKTKWTPTKDSNGYWNTPQAADNSSYGYSKEIYVNNSGMESTLVGLDE